MENSEILLGYALQALRETNVTPSDWAVGGGTVLKTIFHHRESKEFYICKKFIRKANEIEHDRCRQDAHNGHSFYFLKIVIIFARWQCWTGEL